MPRLRLLAPALCVLTAAVSACHTVPPAQAQAQQGADPSAQTVVAEIALQRGDCRAASEAYAGAAQSGPVALARRASQVALSCEDLPAAWQAARRWHALAPSDREATLIYATVAVKLYQIDAARTALAPLVRAVDAQHESDLIALVALLTQESDATAALATLDTTVDAKTATPRVLAAFGELALDAYDFGRAERRANQALQREANYGNALRLLARVRALRGDADGALAMARQVAELGGNDGAFAVADVLTELDRVEEARQELDRLRGEQVPKEEIDRRLALLAYQSGDWTDAQHRFKALLDRGEASQSALFYLGETAAHLGDTDAALAAYRQLSDSPMALSARTRAAALLMEHGKRGEGLELLDSYESEHPESGLELAIAKAHLLADHGDAQSGVAVLSAALERYPQHPTLEYERATMLERAGHFPDAIQAFEQLLKSRPDDPNLMNALGYTLADHGAQLSRAEGLIRRALLVTPDNPAVLDSLAWVRLRRGDARAAVPTLARAYSISRDAEIAAHWGEALWLAGSQTQARQVWAAALARNPDSQALKATVHRLLPAGGP